MKFVLKGNHATETSQLQLHSAESVIAPLKCGDTNSYTRSIAKAGWIFSRAEGLLLAATATTSEMPGGMKRLTHEISILQFAEISNRKIGIAGT